MKKTDLPHALAVAGRFAGKAIADTMGVAPSHLVERTKPQAKLRRRYNKADDVWLLPLIRKLVGSRATYGYRRICLLLNRKLNEMAKSVANPSASIIMRRNGLLLGRHTGKRRTPSHEGKVVSCAPTCAGPPMASRFPVGTAGSAI